MKSANTWHAAAAAYFDINYDTFQFSCCDFQNIGEVVCVLYMISCCKRDNQK